MNDVVLNAALSTGQTTKALLVSIANEQGFTNGDEVGVSWWRKRQNNMPIPPIVHKECERIINQSMAFSHG